MLGYGASDFVLIEWIGHVEKIPQVDRSGRVSSENSEEFSNSSNSDHGKDTDMVDLCFVTRDGTSTVHRMHSPRGSIISALEHDSL